MTIGLPIPFSVLDAAVERCLPGYVLYSVSGGGIVKFQREQITSGSVIYKISGKEPGDLGSVKVYMLSAEMCDMQIDEPKLPASRDPTEEELAAIRNIADKEERFKAYAALGKKIRQERDELHRKNRDLQGVIISAFFNRLSRERIWPEGQPKAAMERRAMKERASSSIPDWVLTTERGLENWKKAYNIMVEVDKEYEIGYWNGLYKDSPKPGLDDYREALRAEGLKYCGKRVRQIRRAGKEGWIDLKLDLIRQA